MDFNSRPNSRDSYSQPMSSPNNHFYHHSSPQQTSATSPPQSLQSLPAHLNSTSATAMPSMSAYPTIAQHSEYAPNNQMTASQYNVYMQQYYREYYRQYLQHQRLQQQSSRSSSSVTTSRSALRQPLKYGSRRCHARAVFSQHNNDVLVIDNTSVGTRPVRVYSLCELFVDYLFPNQMLHVLLRDGQLPILSRESALQWIRCKQQLTPSTTASTTTTATDVNFELKLILRVIQMLLKQNARISGLDLSELLLDLSDSQSLNQNFIYSENEFRNQSLNAFRALLIRGQRTVALNHALATGLMDHALALSYLMGEERRPETPGEDLMLKTIRKFCDTLRADDPISVFYSSLLNRIQRKHNFLELSFESFLVLLSNEMDLSSVSVKSTQFQHLLAFVKSLMTPEDDFVLSEELFECEMDSLLVNECLELARFSGQRFNRRLIDKKVKFVSILFDFGFDSNALKYCQQLKGFCDLSSTTRRLVSQIESRFDQNISFETTSDDNDDSEPLWARPDTQLSGDDTYQTTPLDESETTPDVETTVKPLETIPPISEVQQSATHDFYAPPSVPTGPPFAPPVIPMSQMTFNQPLSPLSPPMSQQMSQPPIQPPIQPINQPMNQPMGQPLGAMGGAPESVPNGDIPFSFVSSSQSLPSMPFNSNEFFENETKDSQRDDDNKATPQTTTHDNNERPTTEKATNSGFLSKLLGFKAKNQAVLPDDSKMTLVFDKNTNQWIDTSQTNGTPVAPPALRPPPVMAPTGAPAPKNFGFRSQRRYVDITRKE